MKKKKEKANPDFNLEKTPQLIIVFGGLIFTLLLFFSGVGS